MSLSSGNEDGKNKGLSQNSCFQELHDEDPLCEERYMGVDLGGSVRATFIWLSRGIMVTVSLPRYGAIAGGT